MGDFFMREFVIKCCVCKKDLCRVVVFSDDDDVRCISLFCNSCSMKTIDWNMSLRKQEQDKEESWASIQRFMEKGGHLRI